MRTGRILRNVIESVINKHPEILSFVDSLGKGDLARGAPELLLEKLRMEICAALGQPPQRPADPAGSPWRADLVGAIIEHSADPEVHLVAWIRDGAPIGAARPIEASGVFPLAESRAEGQGLLHQLFSNGKGLGNYTSITEHRHLVEPEFERIDRPGYIEVFAS